MNLSEEIRQCHAGCVRNPYQSNDKRVLFVCSMGILRSATGSRIYGHKYNTRCAGTHPEALIPVTALLLEWADEIVFVNPENHRAVYEDGCWLDEKKVAVLNIPDQYEHMHRKIVEAFNEQYERVDPMFMKEAND